MRETYPLADRLRLEARPRLPFGPSSGRRHHSRASLSPAAAFHRRHARGPDARSEVGRSPCLRRGQRRRFLDPSLLAGAPDARLVRRQLQRPPERVAQAFRCRITMPVCWATAPTVVVPGTVVGQSTAPQSGRQRSSAADGRAERSRINCYELPAKRELFVRTERRRSRTYPATGYAASPVLKICYERSN
jgi:hypothetical protein